ncbi:hypothetical protein QQ045_007531 [Rhodiola kirilowii]
MEDSFKVRVDKVFGSLSDSQPLNSLWSLTDEEIERKEWNRDKGIHDQDDLSGPFASRPSASVSIRQGGAPCLIKELNEGDDDLDDLDDDSSRLAAKPDDHDDEEWLIRSSVGMDCTLDKEEEEDEYDKIAAGIEKNEDRVSMHKITDYITGRDYVAAKRTLKEDVQETGDLKSYAASDRNQMVIPFTKTSNNFSIGVKSILKKDVSKAMHKSLKRVRFDPETASDLEEQAADRSVKFASGSGVEGQASFPPPKADPRVPDYLRNPSKYTQYTLDSTNELDDEEANRKAYMDFFNLIRKKHADESQPAEDMSDSSKPIIFKLRKKTGDDLMERNDPLKKGDHKENIQNKVVSPVIAAADEACAMEEDETDMTPVCSTIPRKAQRQYRAKPIPEPRDE